MFKRIIISMWLFFAMPAVEASGQTEVMPNGDGSESNPYQIATLSNLRWVTQNSSSWNDNFIQTADINAGDTKDWNITTARFSDDIVSYGFSGIGNSVDEFGGTYDGQGHTIDSLHIFTLFGSERGFFSQTYGATVKNLGITNADIQSGGSNIGALIGSAEQSSVIENCYSTGNIVMVTDPTDQGAVSGWGGLIGQCYKYVDVSNCYSNVDIDGAVTVAVYQGNTFDHYNKRIVTSAGGFVGWTYLSTVKESYSSGNVIGGDEIGGFIGHNSTGSTINDCYSFGKAVRDSNSQASPPASNFGGFCGYNEDSEISNCYSIGTVEYEVGTNPTDKGFTGNASSDGSIDYKMLANFWDTDLSSQSASAGSTANSSEIPVGKTTAEMKSITTFADASWDFSTPVWRINEYLNDGYPYLSWEEFTNDVIDIPTIVSDSVFVLNGADIGFQSQSNTVDVQFELKDTTPPNFPSGAPYVGVYWDISDVTGGSVKLRLYYSPEDTAGFSGAPKIFHYNGSSWVELQTSAEMVDGNERYVETINYFNSFSPVTIGDGANPLPVELVSFTAEQTEDEILLQWQTATEVNNYGFSIERMVDSSGWQVADNKQPTTNNWQAVGFVQGHGNSNSPKNYEFIDDLSDLAEDLQRDSLVYRLKQIDTDGSYTYYNTTASVDGITGIEEVGLPEKYALSQNYPNPFNPATTISYSIPYSVISTGGRNLKDFSASGNSLTPRNDKLHVSLKVYDTLGREVATLVNENQGPGKYEVMFDGSSLSSGVYYYKLEAGNPSAGLGHGFVKTRKLMLLK